MVTRTLIDKQGSKQSRLPSMAALLHNCVGQAWVVRTNQASTLSLLAAGVPDRRRGSVAARGAREGRTWPTLEALRMLHMAHQVWRAATQAYEDGGPLTSSLATTPTPIWRWLPRYSVGSGASRGSTSGHPVRSERRTALPAWTKFIYLSHRSYLQHHGVRRISCRVACTQGIRLPRGWARSTSPMWGCMPDR